MRGQPTLATQFRRMRSSPEAEATTPRLPDAGPAPLEDDRPAGKSRRSRRFQSRTAGPPLASAAPTDAMPHASHRTPRRRHRSQTPHRRAATRRLAACIAIRRLIARTAFRRRAAHASQLALGCLNRRPASTRRLASRTTAARVANRRYTLVTPELGRALQSAAP